MKEKEIKVKLARRIALQKRAMKMIEKDDAPYKTERYGYHMNKYWALMDFMREIKGR